MSLDIRSPDFPALYPTRQAYEAAQILFNESARPDLAARAIIDPSIAIRHWLSDGVLPAGFSLRVMCSAFPGLNDTRIESDYEGTITQMLLVVPKFDDALRTGAAIDPRLARHFRRLIECYGERVQFVVVSTKNQRREFEGWSGHKDTVFIDAPLFKFTHWAQDPFIVLRDRKDDSATRLLFEAVRFTRSEDMTIADEIAMQAPPVGCAVPSYLFYQGGNVLGGRSLTLVGQDHISRNAGRVGMKTDDDVVKAMAKQFGTEILPLGGPNSGDDYSWRALGVLTGLGRQPIFHIDMYVSRTGVVDPKTRKEIAFLGRPDVARQILKRSSNLSHLDNPKLDEFFEETEKQLSTRFTVRRLPLWWTYGQIANPRLREKYYVLTWNNVLVESEGGKSRVLLPRYDDPGDCQDYRVDLADRERLQEYAEDAWKSIGCEVHLSDGVEDLAWGDGAIHCLVKVLRRTHHSAATSSPAGQGAQPTPGGRTPKPAT